MLVDTTAGAGVPMSVIEDKCRIVDEPPRPFALCEVMGNVAKTPIQEVKHTIEYA